MKYCTNCNKAMKPIKKPISWPLFILLSVLTLGILAVVQLLFHVVFKRKNKCRECGDKMISINKYRKLLELQKEFESLESINNTEGP